eukprot:jgi/Bigna1/77527/fgenesh1_pg.48_\
MCPFEAEVLLGLPRSGYKKDQVIEAETRFCGREIGDRQQIRRLSLSVRENHHMSSFFGCGVCWRRPPPGQKRENMEARRVLDMATYFDHDKDGLITREGFDEWMKSICNIDDKERQHAWWRYICVTSLGEHMDTKQQELDERKLDVEEFAEFILNQKKYRSSSLSSSSKEEGGNDGACEKETGASEEKEGRSALNGGEDDGERKPTGTQQFSTDGTKRENAAGDRVGVDDFVRLCH